MKQQVNLYTDELRPRQVVLPFKGVLVVWLVVAASLFVIGMWWAQRASVGEERLSDAEQGRDAVVAEVARAQQLLDGRKVSPSLLAEQTRLEHELRRARAFNSQVSLRLTRQTGLQPSGIMQALARQVDTSWLWLTGLALDQAGQFILKGETLEPKRVPEWLAALGREQAFDGMTFTYMDMVHKADERAARFVISAQPLSETEGRP